jgi:hypothetical protein
VEARLSLSLIALLLGASLFAQSAAPPVPAPNRDWLAGTWKLDRSGPPEDEKNWNRQTRPTNRTTPADAGKGSGGMPAPIPDRDNIASINTFGLTLIAASETLVFQVQPDAVTMRDDFREPMRYETNGRARTMEVLAGSARSVAVSAPRSFTVSLKSSWNGDALVQEVWTRETREIVRITRTFIPFDEGRKMLLVIKVLEPKLKDPVKDIERVYVR